MESKGTKWKLTAIVAIVVLAALALFTFLPFDKFGLGEQPSIVGNVVKDLNIEPTEVNNLVRLIIELRTYSQNEDLINVAEVITELKANNIISSPIARNPWQNIITCVYSSCEDKAYLDLIDVVVITQSNKDTELIHSIIETFNYWDGKNLLEFSESLTDTNQLIAKRSDALQLQWNSIVECNAECSEFTDQIISLIGKVVS